MKKLLLFFTFFSISLHIFAQQHIKLTLADNTEVKDEFITKGWNLISINNNKTYAINNTKQIEVFKDNGKSEFYEVIKTKIYTTSNSFKQQLAKKVH